MSKKKWKTALVNLFLEGFVFFNKRLKPKESFDSARDFRSIVIYSTTALGDLMFNTPAIKAIRQRYPDAFITLVSSEKNRGLVSDCAYFQQVVYWDEKIKDIVGLVSSLKKSKPELAIILHSKAPYDVLSAVMAGCEYVFKDVYGNKTTGMEKWIVNSPVLFDGHLIQRKLNLLKLLDCDVSDKEMFIPIIFPEVDKDTTKISIGFQMGASETLRCWPVTRFVELAEKLSLLGPEYRIVLIGTNKEKGYEQEFFNALPESAKGSVVSYIGKTDLKTLLGILKNVDVLVTGDTGPLHLAVALKTRTVSLFVTANPSHTGPYQDPELHQILQVPYEAAKQSSPSLEQPLSVIGSDAVLEKIISLLSKNQ